MNEIRRYALMLMALSVFTVDALAAAREYDFEIIIFEDTSTKYLDAEQWPDWTPATRPGQKSNEVINIVPIDSIGLDRYVKKLDSSNRYNVLVHKSWRQAGLSDNASVSIPIDSRGERNGDPVLQPGSAGNERQITTGIHGEIKLVLGRYLHLYTDLVYQQPRSQPPPAWQTLNTSPYKDYHLKYHRKMRSKELHYIDHPLVGILVMALPVKEAAGVSQ